ncbi:hypothetical protein OIE68_45120 [Nocardia vinacea]|uniref:hypothetical protein n=1 Tax=Nocardia vinacea TaxID=96468 RepID=UPI002E144496|nr:hypothetical protein OIE68_45120 [Nocardia vinacea]
MRTEAVAVTDVRIGDVIKSDNSELWLEVDEIGSLAPQPRDGAMPGEPDEYYTGHYFCGPMIDGVGVKGDRHCFSYRDDLLVVRREAL